MRHFPTIWRPYCFDSSLFVLAAHVCARTMMVSGNKIVVPPARKKSSAQVWLLGSRGVQIGRIAIYLWSRSKPEGHRFKSCPRNQISKKPQQSEWLAGVAILADFPSNDINDLAHGFKSPCNHTDQQSCD